MDGKIKFSRLNVRPIDNSRIYGNTIYFCMIKWKWVELFLVGKNSQSFKVDYVVAVQARF